MLLNFPPIDLSSAACTVVMTPDANYLIPASRVGQMSIRFHLTHWPLRRDIYGRSTDNNRDVQTAQLLCQVSYRVLEYSIGNGSSLAD